MERPKGNPRADRTSTPLQVAGGRGRAPRAGGRGDPRRVAEFALCDVCLIFSNLGNSLRVFKWTGEESGFVRERSSLVFAFGSLLSTISSDCLSSPRLASQRYHHHQDALFSAGSRVVLRTGFKITTTTIASTNIQRRIATCSGFGLAASLTKTTPSGPPRAVARPVVTPLLKTKLLMLASLGLLAPHTKVSPY